MNLIAHACGANAFARDLAHRRINLEAPPNEFRIVGGHFEQQGARPATQIEHGAESKLPDDTWQNPQASTAGAIKCSREVLPLHGTGCKRWLPQQFGKLNSIPAVGKLELDLAGPPVTRVLWDVRSRLTGAMEAETGWVIRPASAKGVRGQGS